MGRIKVMLEDPGPCIRGLIVYDQVTLNMAPEEVHYWSPQLNFRVEADEDDPNHSVISGLIGPRPSVWTMFMFIYFSVGTIGFFITTHGVSKWLLGEYSHALWAFPLAILFMLTAYRAGKYGESLAADQVEVLKQFVRDAVNVVS